MSSPKQLKARYPYMFAGQHIGLGFYRGWIQIFAVLCDEVDQLLGDDKHGFHWFQTKEKFGVARFYWSIQSAPAGADADRIASIKRQLNELVAAACERTAHTCIVCGEPGTLDHTGLHLLTLCGPHAAQRRADTRLVYYFDESSE